MAALAVPSIPKVQGIKCAWCLKEPIEAPLTAESANSSTPGVRVKVVSVRRKKQYCRALALPEPLLLHARGGANEGAPMTTWTGTPYRKMLAERIVAHLKLSNWQFVKGVQHRTTGSPARRTAKREPFHSCARSRPHAALPPAPPGPLWAATPRLEARPSHALEAGLLSICRDA